MSITFRRPACLTLLAIAVALAATGCAGRRAMGLSPPLHAADYTEVILTGSHIPVRVPTSPTARRLPTTSPLVILTPDEFGRLAAPPAMRIH